MNIEELVVVGVTLSNGVGRRGDKSVVVGDVGGKTTDTGSRSATSLLEEAVEEGSSGLQIGGPPEPASVASIDVDVDVGLGKSLPSVDGKSLVSGLGVGAFGDVQVGDQVGQTIRLIDSDDANIRV